MAIWRGWIVLFATSLVWLTLAFGASMGWAFFLPHLKESTGMTDSIAGISWAVALCGAAVIVPYAGRAVDVLGAWRVIAICLVPASVSIACIQFSSTPWHVTAFQLVNRILLVGAVCCACQKVVAAWFITRKPLASFVISISDVSLYLVAILIDAFIQFLGWKKTCYAVALALVFPAHMIFLGVARNTPAELGTSPDGALSAPDPSSPLECLGFGNKDWTLVEARRTPVFWVLSLSFTSFELYMPGFCYHSVAIMSSAGFDNDGVRLTFLNMTIFGLVGSLGTKVLLDGEYFGTGTRAMTRLLSISLAIGALAPALFLVFSAGAHLWQAALYGAFIGLMSGGQQVIMNIVWSTAFGFAHCGHIAGFNYRINFVGTGLGPLLIGYNLELKGNTHVVQFVLMVFLLLCAMALMVVPLPHNVTSTGTCDTDISSHTSSTVVGAEESNQVQCPEHEEVSI